MEEKDRLPLLSAEEIRVLGALIEKSKTTPDYYPLTLNSLVTACNQKSARNPVVDYDNEIVVMALDSLKKKGLVANVLGDGRTTKYRHTIAVKYPLDPAELTVLGLLFLRGPLTAGEINSNSGRMYEFDNLEEVQQVLENLSNSETNFIQQLPKKHGQKEGRFCHLFMDIAEVENEMESGYQEPARKHVSDLEERLVNVENELAVLKDQMQKLMIELYGE